MTAMGSSLAAMAARGGGPSAYAVELAKKGGSALKKRKQKCTVFKTTVGSPYAFEWPALQADDTLCLLTVLESACKDDVVQKKRGGRRSKKERKRTSTSAVKAESAEEATQAAPCLLMGVNRVTRALERNARLQGSGKEVPEGQALALVLVCKDVRPQLLVEHLPVQASLQRVPVCVLATGTRDSSFRLGKLLGLPTVMAIAVTGAGCQRYSRLLSYCKTRTCDIALPWLAHAAPEEKGGKEQPRLCKLVAEPRRKQRKYAEEQEATGKPRVRKDT